MGNFREGHVNQEECGHGEEYYQRPLAGCIFVGHSKQAGGKKGGHQNQRKVVIGCASLSAGLEMRRISLSILTKHAAANEILKTHTTHLISKS